MCSKGLNNKGFAISGILYTLFALFLIIMFSILAMTNFKKNILINTTDKLEDIYTINLVSDISLALNTNERKTKIVGKYVFEFIDETTSEAISCVAYLDKGVEIPTNSSENFDLIPSDCNNSSYDISLDVNDVSSTDKMVLKEIYEFKG